MKPAATDRLQPAVDALQEAYQKGVEAMEAKTDADIVGTLWTVAIACLGCVALGSAVAFAVAQSVVRPATELRSRRQSLEETCLASLSCSLTAIGKGDFTVGAVGSTTPIESPSQDELGQTCAVFNAMLARIHAAIADLNHARSSLIHAVTGIRVCARQVWSDDAGQGAGVADSIKQVTLTIAESAHTSQDMAAGSEALASTASEAASNMEEMDRAIEEMSGLASRVLGEASSALEDARKGEQSLSELVAALEQISGQTKSSMAAVLKLGEQQEKIGAIVNTIEEISDQTNLLALNAAIEAARAGQHERGFAVVAEEVRKLAERAGSSTKEITDLIGTIRMGVERTHAEMTASVRAVVQGREVGVQASSALARIAEAASTVRALSEDAQSQAKGLAESAQSVSGLVTQVASISQESAAGTEQISSGFHEIAASATQVSGDLSSAAEELTSLVNAFTVEKESRLMLAA